MEITLQLSNSASLMHELIFKNKYMQAQINVEQSSFVIRNDSQVKSEPISTVTKETEYKYNIITTEHTFIIKPAPVSEIRAYQGYFHWMDQILHTFMSRAEVKNSQCKLKF